MNVLFRFRCSTCGKEILTDSVLLKCCNRLMDNVEHITMSSQELQMLISGGSYQGLVKLTNGKG
ncbi:hypothetical protein [Ammoniphilus resinae]|uniref:Uncharacterized protein n=1 Tax=Ammoniphilus resinae TaxID=861532 RepID=A0ABS4GX19_9BACL|nr:hypothetical protein [Ammoniphilus resinae]MBP1934796.1 hypothetical protein [Ammoniphilus resinae]